MSEAIHCPMHPDPKPVLDDSGECPECGRTWEKTNHGMMSKPRRVQVVAPLEPGANIDECIKPTNSLQSFKERLKDQINPDRKEGCCIGCNQPFSNKNVHTEAGWRETKISGYCEDCFDEYTAMLTDL